MYIHIKYVYTYKICILVIKFTYFNFIYDIICKNKIYIVMFSIEIEKIFISKFSKINIDHFDFHIYYNYNHN